MLEKLTPVFIPPTLDPPPHLNQNCTGREQLAEQAPDQDHRINKRMEEILRTWRPAENCREWRHKARKHSSSGRQEEEMDMTAVQLLPPLNEILAPPSLEFMRLVLSWGLIHRWWLSPCGTGMLEKLFPQAIFTTWRRLFWCYRGNMFRGWIRM